MENRFRLPVVLMATGFVLLLGCQKESARDVGPKTTPTTQNRPAPPDNPPVDCTLHPEQCPPNYPDEPGNGPYFSSSEGRGLFTSTENPSGGIVDIIVITDLADVPGGYTVLGQDLNAGVSYMWSPPQLYAAFTRNPQAARDYRHDSYSHTSTITDLVAYKRDSQPDPFNGNPTRHWIGIKGYLLQDNVAIADMNDRAGGEEIWASFAKVYGNPNVEVAVVNSQTNPTPNIPTGYVLVPKDLNAGNGGDYVHFCVKPQ